MPGTLLWRKMSGKTCARCHRPVKRWPHQALYVMVSQLLIPWVTVAFFLGLKQELCFAFCHLLLIIICLYIQQSRLVVLLQFRHFCWLSVMLGFGRTSCLNPISVFKITHRKLHVYTMVVWFSILIHNGTNISNSFLSWTSVQPVS